MNHIKAMQLAMDHLMNLQPILGNGLLEERQLAFIDPHIDCAMTALQEGLAEQTAQQEPAATAYFEKITGRIVPPDDTHRRKFPMCYRPLVFGDTTPPARKPLHIGEETAAFKEWFDAWWIGDGEQGETIPTQSDKHFLTYLDQYTLGFGAWMAAKHAAHGIKENT